MKKRGFLLLIVLSLLLTMLVPLSFAQGTQTSGEIDSILVVKEDGTVVSVSVDDYYMMYILRSGALYDYLKSSDGSLTVYGISSGDKYIDIDNYFIAYILSGNDIAAALESAEAFDEELVTTFMRVESVNEETGEVILAPIFGQEPSIEATFIQRGLANFGFVISEVNNLPDAAKFRVGYYVNNNGIPQMEWTEIVNINEEAGSIVYNPNSEPPYNMVNVEIYNESEELIWTFENIILRIPEENSTLQMLITPNLVIYN